MKIILIGKSSLVEKASKLNIFSLSDQGIPTNDPTKYVLLFWADPFDVLTYWISLIYCLAVAF